MSNPSSDGAAAVERPAPVAFREAFAWWLKLGFISFGGPAGQIAMMHQELVERRRWISERRFLHALNYCMLLPGPEAQQLATYIGWLMHGVRGGLVAGGLFVLPSLAILIALTWIYMVWGQVPVVAGILAGIKPAVTAIVLFAAWRIGTRTLRNPVLWAIAIAAFVAITFLRLPFPLIILGAGLAGIIGGRTAPRFFSAGGGHGAAKTGYGPAIIDDDTPSPAWARFSRARLGILLGVFFVIWLAALLAVSVIDRGWNTLGAIGWFFTKAAFLTFGGAYAVLPYVFDAAVNDHGWLSTAQMMDGLALGETTPGPLIMIVAFVGFVAAWTKAVFGASALVAAGIAGACVATFFTFLPSFLFILAGGPLVERTHGDLKFTAPLTAITAAVVGVIVNLAVFFAEHVLWPQGAGGPVNWIAALIGVGAFVALVRFKVGIIQLVVACGVLGAVLTFLGVRV